MADSPSDKLAEQMANAPILGPGYDFASVTDKISAIVLTRRTPKWWIIGFLVSFALVMLLMVSVTYLLVAGVGIWGIQIPVAWGFAIINFVWWIGIGHAGTLISAILLLLRQQWRTSINRFAEAMTLFAVSCAGIFPLIHMGRPWLGYWLFPYPDTMKMWPNFRSPLVWDAFAVSTYATVSLLFWFIGLIPDLATLRDRSKNRAAKMIYGLLAMGWRGSAVHWERHETASLLLAGLATPLVLSVHTIVSFDFAFAIVPGWHATIFPPYFVAGAIYAGFAMVLTLSIPMRKLFRLEDFITMRHLDNMGKVLLATGLIVGYGYMMEAFSAFYSGNQYERFMILNRMTGTLRSDVLDVDRLQHRDSAISVVPKSSGESGRAVRHRHGRERGHVARAVCHRGDQLAPRFPSVVLGNLLPDPVGHFYICRNDRPLPVPGVSLPPLLAADLDFRNADAGGERGREEGGKLMRAAEFYFSLMAKVQ